MFIISNISYKTFIAVLKPGFYLWPQQELTRGQKKRSARTFAKYRGVFFRESSRLRIFVREVNAKRELFSWADRSA